MVKSLGNHAGLSNLNLRGKKFKLLGCQCCEARDLREREENKRISREMREELVSDEDGKGEGIRTP